MELGQNLDFAACAQGAGDACGAEAGLDPSITHRKKKHAWELNLKDFDLPNLRQVQFPYQACCLILHVLFVFANRVKES